ncbi:hypothetical protein [Devosia elaeis]|uniref:Uncharacterized protein n=1 Tax=Devosia elaeis TaxID=1770058 RepID=A0A178HP36_9HYPH|nr:hypothetical protein [Devosia elaeis]OAM73776.1 hypothetical protein A3840_17430 [Devosia elaeis]
MANLPEQNTYPSGIYQIELTDPVVGGPDGISNVQARQLANRTRWLKQIADEVVEARGEGGSSLAARLAGYDAFSPEQQVSILAGVQEALGLGGLLARELANLRGRVLAQGTVTIKNKHVITGMVLTKTEIRALHLSQTGDVGTGISRAQIDGMIVSLPDDDYHVSVPSNESDEARTYFAYLVNTGGVSYGVQIDQQVPDTGLPLYRIEVPANNTGNSLSAVTLTDLRVIQATNSWVASYEPFASVAFPDTLPAADYGVELEVEDATNIAAVGTLEAYDKMRNGFKIRQTGSADNVRIRWTLLNLRYQ